MTRRFSTGYLSRTEGLAVASLVALVAAGCSDGPTEPRRPDSEQDTVVLSFSDDTADIQLVGPESGTLIQRRVVGGTAPGTPARGLFFAAQVVDSRLLGSLSPDPEVDENVQGEELISLRIPALSVQWREWVSRAIGRSGQSIDLLDLTHVGREGRRFYLRAKRGEEEHGVAVLDGDRRFVAFLGGFVDDDALRVGGPVEVSAPEGGDDLLVAAGARPGVGLRVMVYGTEDLRLRDSVSVGRPTGNVFVRLQGVVSARDGRHVYALTLDSLMRVDVRVGEVVARTPRERPSANFSPMAVSPDPQRVFVADPGSFDFPGSGKIQVYAGSDLSSVGPVEVTGSMNDLAVSEDGDRLFVVAGTDLIGGFGQEASLSVVDVEALERVRKHDFADRLSLNHVVAF